MNDYSHHRRLEHPLSALSSTGSAMVEKAQQEVNEKQEQESLPLGKRTNEEAFKTFQNAETTIQTETHQKRFTAIHLGSTRSDDHLSVRQRELNEDWRFLVLRNGQGGSLRTAISLL